MCGMFYSSCVKVRTLNEELTKEELTNLIQRTKWNLIEIEEFYHRFIHCYPNGFLSENDLIIYFKKLRHNQSMNNDLIEMIRKIIFHFFDLNKNHRIDFNEFLFLNEFLYLKSFNEKIKYLCQQKLSKSFENLQYSLNNIEIHLENFFYLIDDHLNFKLKNKIFIEKIRSNLQIQSKKSMKFKEILCLINENSYLFNDEETNSNSSSSSNLSLIQRVQLF